MTVLNDPAVLPGYQLHSPKPAEFDRVAATIYRAYGGFGDAQDAHEMNREIFEFDRAVTARKDDRICGTATIYSLRMTVPGGPIDVAGVGYVSVAPDHRRRGLMRAMLAHQLRTLHEQGRESVVALNATEGGIYGRFGYGLASQVVRLRIPRGQTTLLPHRPADMALRIEATTPADCLPHMASCYEPSVAARPGMLGRDETWARRAILDPVEARGGAAPLQALLATDGRVRGYALYTIRSNWEDSSPRNIVVLREIFAQDDAAYAELWAALLDIDLTATVLADTRPVDDPILAMLTDLRTAVPQIRDQLHVRPVDVDRALSARRYTFELDLVLEVSDEFCPWNSGRWRLRGGPDGAECERTERLPDLGIQIRALGSAFLGGISLRQLAAAGQITEYTAGALAVAAQAFRHDPAPFCPTTF